MKAAVSASGKTLDSQVDPRFGRCAYFVFVDPDSLEFEAFTSESAMASGGASIQAAQFVATRGAEVVITGHLGPNAMTTLKAADIKIYMATTGSVREAVEAYKKNGLEEISDQRVRF